MNYFHLDKNTIKSAQYLHDVHLRKMCTETAQMLSTAVWIVNCDFAESAYARGELMFPAYEHHPCTKWCVDNLDYMAWYFKAITDEYFFRFRKIHKSTRILPSLENLFLFGFMPYETPVVLCMPDVYKTKCPVTSYRAYYRGEKQYDKNGKFIAIYTNREKPYWL